MLTKIELEQLKTVISLLPSVGLNSQLVAKDAILQLLEKFTYEEEDVPEKNIRGHV
jgi:hypothetical protein